jgi:two-component system phosphate regulon response regulator PhoB
MRTLPRILIVEDEPAIAELIAVNLKHNGFQPIWAIDAETAQRELNEILPDVSKTGRTRALCLKNSLKRS